MTKRIFFSLTVLIFTSTLYAQEGDVLLKHELKASLGPALVSDFWLQDDGCHTNFSIAYFYRIEKRFWAGVNFIQLFGNKINYDWREYGFNGSFNDFSKSKMKYCAIIAPEIRLSYYSEKDFILYGAFSGGFAWENGYDNKTEKYPIQSPYLQITWFGFSCIFGKNNNIFLGGELGFGCKGLISMHGGYMF